MTDKTDALERVFCKEGHDSWGQWGHWYRDDAGGGVEYLRADLAAPKVRALDWAKPLPAANPSYSPSMAWSPFGLYYANEHAFWSEGDEATRCQGIEAAKAAAQADFEARVLACLETTKPAPDGTGQ